MTSQSSAGIVALLLVTSIFCIFILAGFLSIVAPKFYSKLARFFKILVNPLVRVNTKYGISSKLSSVETNNPNQYGSDQDPDILTSPLYSHLPGNIYYDSSRYDK